MRLNARVSFVLLWIASLVLVGVIASAQTQTRRDPGPVISGSDLGFRPEAGWVEPAPGRGSYGSTANGLRRSAR